MKSIISFVLKNVPRKYLQLFSHYILKVLAVFYAGNRVTCNVCGSKFKKFIPYGRESRGNALCPHCLSLERHRVLWQFLNEKTDFFSAQIKMLHVAPELCFIKRFEAMENLDYITADIESPLAKVKMDVHDIPFEDNTFDVVFCNHVLEHVEDDEKVLSEFYRVLKPGGWGIFQIPIEYDREKTIEDTSITDPKERIRLFGQDDHVRAYGVDYPEIIKSAGFTVEMDDFVEQMSEEERFSKGFPHKETMYLAIK